jgi:hypothetical protein
MSFTNKTAHYELPQWTQNDIPTVLVDMNGAFSDIDTAIYNASVNGTEAKEVVETIQPTVTQLTSDVASLSSDVTQNSASIVTLNNKVTALQTQNGSEVLETTAQTLSGGVNELKNRIDSIPASTVDTAMSSTSTNAVQNRVIKAYVDAQGVAEEKQTGTLAAGATSVTLTFAEQTIGATTLVNWFVSDPTVNPTNITTTANTVVMTFEAQSSALTVGALVKN